jgi:CDP-2,3-bis-(O-geranylgeranyl)-sn-glycerol synthase
MLLIIIQSLFFFLPAYCANMTPVIFARFHIFESLNVPIDGDRKIWGQPLLGATKTYRGLVCGTLVGILVVLFQYLFFISFSGITSLYIFPYSFSFSLFLGFVLGFGDLMGDIVKSFFKRRCAIKSTKPFIPFDQMDYLGALIPAWLLFPIPYQHFLLLLFLSPVLPIIANIIAYKIGWKKVFW